MSSNTDYTLFVAPYLTQIETIRSSVIMQPYAWNGVGNYGYDPVVGLYGGGAIEPSNAIGQGSSTRAYIIADNNHEGATAIDYFNSLKGITTNILGAVRTQYASPNWYVCGSCTQPFKHVSYPSSFAPYLNRWEFALGSTSPYYAQMKAGTVVPGGIGQDGCQGTGGQINWQLASASATTVLDPPMVTVFPMMSPISLTGGLESSIFEVMARFMRGDTTWKTGAQSAIDQYSTLAGQAPRAAYHWIRLMRSLSLWDTTKYSFTPPSGVSSVQQALSTVLAQVFTSTGSTGPLGVRGAYGGTQGMSQNWGTPDHRPEANMQTMAMMDPRAPSWFGGTITPPPPLPTSLKLSVRVV